MKTGMFVLGALIVTCAVTFVSGREPNRASADGVLDDGCSVLNVNVSKRADSPGIERIPGPAANFLEIGLWARDRWHRFTGEPLDREDCVYSPER